MPDGTKEIRVVVVGDAKQYEASMAKAEETTSKFGKSSKTMAGAQKVATGVLVGGGAALYEFTKKALEGQTSEAKFTTAVKNTHVPLQQSKAALEQNVTAGAKLGFTQNDITESYATALTATHSNADATRDLAMAQDLARAKGISLSASMKQIVLGYAGSTRVAKQFGITVVPATDHVTAATAKLKAEHIATTSAIGKNTLAQAKLQDKQETSLGTMAKVQKALHGNADAYSGTAQGKLEAFTATWQNFEEQMGNAVLPVMEKFITIGTQVASVLEKHKTIVVIVAGVLVGLAATIKTVTFAQKAWKAVSDIWAGAMKVWNLLIGQQTAAITEQTAASEAMTGAQEVQTAATEEATGATIGLDAAMDANPIGLVVVAIAALVGGLVILYEKSKTARDIINATWTVIKTYAVTVFDALKTYFMVWWDLVKGIFKVASDILHGRWSQAWQDMKSTAINIWDTIKNFLGNIPSDILHAIGDLSKLLLGEGSKLMNGLLGGIKSGWKLAIGFLNNIPSLIGNAFSGAAKWLVNAGGNIASGLLSGIKSGLSDLGSDIIKWIEALLPSASSLLHDIGSKLHIPHLATGGIIDTPTLAVIGEAGPEAVVPLSGLNLDQPGNLNVVSGAQAASALAPPVSAAAGMGSGGGITINVSVGTAIGQDLNSAGKQLADPIYRELLRRSKRNTGLGFA